MHFEYVIRFADLRSAFADDYWRSYWKPRSFALSVAIQLALALLIDEWSELGSPSFVAGFVSCGLLISLTYSVVAGRIVAWITHRRLAAVHGRVALDVDASGLRTTTRAAQTRFPWTGLTLWRETARAVTLYQADAVCQIIPKSILTAGDLSTMRGFAREAGVRGAL